MENLMRQGLEAKNSEDFGDIMQQQLPADETDDEDMEQESDNLQ